MSTADWSKAEDRKLLRMWLAQEPPSTIRKIADHLEKSKSSVHRRIRHYDADGHKGDRQLYQELTGVAVDPALKPVRLDLPEQNEASSPDSETRTALVWGDVHFPFQDDEALAVLEEVNRELQPDELYCIGDVFDFYQISDHRQPDEQKMSVQELDLQEGTIEPGVQHLGRMVSDANPDRAVFFLGNHEDRWKRMLLKTREDFKLRSLLSIPKVRQALTFEDIIGFEELGFDTVLSYVEGELYELRNKLVLTHGDRANKWVTKSMLHKYGKSVMFGHTHRLQMWTERDLKGQEAAWNIGCLCTLDPHYQKFPDWHHGFAVLTWKKIDGEWFYDTDLVRVHEGKAIWRGQVFKA